MTSEDAESKTCVEKSSMSKISLCAVFYMFTCVHLHTPDIKAFVYINVRRMLVPVRKFNHSDLTHLDSSTVAKIPSPSCCFGTRSDHIQTIGLSRD